METPTAQRLDMRLDKSGDCWIWQGAKGKDGYGHIKLGGHTCRVHRVIWELTNGPIPKGLCVCHKCDNPPCCNPNHLFLGTHMDNMQDGVRKQRFPKGALNINRRKLSVEDVLTIRRLCTEGVVQARLGERFGVSQCVISDIHRRVTWVWVPESDIRLTTEATIDWGKL